MGDPLGSARLRAAWSRAFPRGPGAGTAPAEQPVVALLRRFWPNTRGLRRWIVAATVLAAVLPVVAAAEIWLFAILVDDVLVPRDLGPLPILVVVFVGLNIVAGAVGFAEQMISAWAGEQFVLRLRNTVFGHLLRLSPLQVARHPQGDLLTRLSGDVTALESLLVAGPGQAVEMLVRILVFTGIMLWIDPLLAVLALVATPLFWLLARRFSTSIRRAARERRRRTGIVQSLADEVLGSLAVVQAARAERREQHRYDREGRAAVAAEMQATRLIAFFRPLVDLVELVGAMLVLAAGAWSVASGRLTLGELLAFLTYLTQLYGPVRGITDLLTSAYKAAASGERLVGILGEEPAVREPAHPVRPERIRGAVEFENVTFGYLGADGPAVRRMSLTATPGTVTAIVGPSGSGKSTLTALLLRLVDPDSGCVRLDGVDVRRLPLDDVRASVALLLQDTHLFDGTIADNVRYGHPDASADDVASALRAADATEFVDRLPFGDGYPVGPKGRGLSGGQRRRVALARALLTPAPILVLDEYSTGLDPASTRRAMQTLRCPERTVLLVTHDPTVAAGADRVLVLEHGHLVESGVPELLLAEDSRYRALVAAAPARSPEVVGS